MTERANNYETQDPTRTVQDLENCVEIEYGKFEPVPDSLMAFITPCNAESVRQGEPFRRIELQTRVPVGTQGELVTVSCDIVLEDTCPCPCHKIAVLTFFQYGPNGEYVNVPFIAGADGTKYLRLGKIEEMVVLPPDYKG